MIKKLNLIIISLFLSAAISLPAAQPGEKKEPEIPTDAIGYIVRAIEKYPVVCLAEGAHQGKNPHEFFRNLLLDKRIQNSLDVIVVEFANSRYQAILDDYMSGKDVPYKKLCKAWRDTTISPITTFDSPLYYELLQHVREINRSIPPGKKIRILGGEPPINWEEIKTRADLHQYAGKRDIVPAQIAMEQAFQYKKKVLIFYGGAHLPKGHARINGEIKYNITNYIRQKHPDSVIVIEFLKPGTLEIRDRIPDLIKGKIYETGSHWVGKIKAELFFPGIYTRQTDKKTGETAWVETKLFKGLLVTDIVDALIYIGPESEWETVGASREIYRDDKYWAELNRRSMIRFNRPMNKELRDR